MKKLLTLIILAVIVIGGFVFIKNKSADNASANTLTEPWIVIENNTVSEVDLDGTIVRSLETGDEIANGSTIQTDAEGVAVLYFPDGSQARLDPNTTLTVTEATYDADTDSLVVRLAVSTGRVWSNVVSFVNPDSAWEVETAHAVATVRGTSFGTDADSESTAFIGSESTVAIFALDPNTGEAILETETTITTDEVIELSHADVAVLISEKREITKKKIEDLTRDRINEWLERQQAQDGPLQKRIEELRDQGLTPEEIRITIRTDIQAQFAQRIEERRENLKQILEERQTQTEETLRDTVKDAVADTLPLAEIRLRLKTAFTELGDLELAADVGRISDEELLLHLREEFGASFQDAFKDSALLREKLAEIVRRHKAELDSLQKTTLPKPTGITLKTQTNFTLPVVEGTSVRLEAVLKLDNGTTKNVTNEVTWSVLGPIGSVTNGVFTPKLAPSVAEFGESSGSVTAVWKGELKTFLGTTPIFKVIPKIPVDANGEPLG